MLIATGFGGEGSLPELPTDSSPNSCLDSVVEELPVTVPELPVTLPSTRNGPSAAGAPFHLSWWVRREPCSTMPGC
jgi:hypothetical protein